MCRGIGCGKAAPSVTAIYRKGSLDLQTHPEKSERNCIPKRITRFGALDWKTEGKTMKKFLIATTALVASAGFAAADVSFSGAAGAGVASEAGGDADVYSFVDLDVTMSGESDNGIEFGATIDTTTGFKYDIGDFEFDGAQNGTFGLGSIFIKTGGATLTFDREGIDDLYDGDLDSHDVQFDYAAGDFSASLTYDLNSTADAEYSYKFAYAAGAISASLTGNDLSDNMVLDLGYTVNDMISVGLEHDLGGGTDVTTLSLDYASNGISAGVEFDTADAWSLSLGYSMDAIAINAETDNDSEWEVTGSYDFGGGLSLVGGINHEESYYAGLTMSF